jgi:hypothetical protein
MTPRNTNPNAISEDDEDDDDDALNEGFRTLLEKWKGQDASVSHGSFHDIDGVAPRTSAKSKAKAKAKAARALSIMPTPLQSSIMTMLTLDRAKQKLMAIAAKYELRKQSFNLNVYQQPMQWQSDFSPPKFPHSMDEKILIRKALKRNFVFSDLTDSDLEPLMAAFEKCTFTEDQVIIRQGSPGDYFYILHTGEVNFQVNTTKVGSTGETGASFGEMSLLYTSPRAASVIAAKDTELFRVDQATYRFILQSQTTLERVDGKLCEDEEHSEHSARTEEDVPRSNTKLEDLERHNILGEGDFGQVWLVSECLPDKTRRPYALKIQAKFDLATEGQIERVVEEKEIMTKMNHPFIIKLFQTYQGKLSSS